MILTVTLVLALYQVSNLKCLAGDYKTPMPCYQNEPPLALSYTDADSGVTCSQNDWLCRGVQLSLHEHPLIPPPMDLQSRANRLCTATYAGLEIYVDNQYMGTCGKDGKVVPPDFKWPKDTNTTDHLQWSWTELTEFQGMKVLTIPGTLSLGKCKYPEDVTLETMEGKGKVYCMHLLK